MQSKLKFVLNVPIDTLSTLVLETIGHKTGNKLSPKQVMTL